MKKIKIGRSYLKVSGDYVRLCSDVTENGKTETIWYEVNKKFADYLCTEKMDAFVITLIPYVFEKGLDIEVDGNVSEKLYYGLNNYLIPFLSRYKKQDKIKIIAKLDNSILNNKGAVGTGLSCGVDSFYTIKMHTDTIEKSFNLTCLTFYNVGASGDFGGDDARKLFFDRIDNVKLYAKENNLEFLTVDSNISDYIKMDYVKTHSFRSMAPALALQKYFSKYYYSSGYPFEFRKADMLSDSAYYDILNVQCFSTENLTFYNPGLETNRIGKVKEISKFEPTYKYLNVCVKDDHNCSECEKCLRTLFALDSLGVLDKYGKVFDIEKFRKNKIKNYVFLLKKVYKKNEYYIESYEMYKKRGIHIPFKARLLSFIPDLHDIWFYMPESIRKRLRKYVKRNEKSN